MENDSPFEIIKPDTTNGKLFEEQIVNWNAKFPCLPEDPQGSKATEKQMNLFRYVSSNKHTGGYSIQNPCEWCIQLNPCYIENGKRYISLFVQLHKFLRVNKEPESNSVYALYEFRVLNPENRDINHLKRSSIHRFSEHLPCYGFKKFMPFPIGMQYFKGVAYRELDVQLIISMFTKVDFTIPCTIEDKLKSEETDKVHSFIEEIKDRKRNLVNCQMKKVISELYDRRDKDPTCDIILRSATADHPAHLSILNARSATKIFPPIIVEGDKEIMLCDNYNSATINAFLKLCYKGYTKHFSKYSNALKIFRLTKHFGMNNLKRNCLAEIACHLDSSPKQLFALMTSVLQTKDDNFIEGMMPFFRKFYYRHYQVINADIIIMPNETFFSVFAWIKESFL